LEQENFSTSLAAIPLSTRMKNDPSKFSASMFNYCDYIKKVDVDAKCISFRLKANTTVEQIDEIKYPLYLEVKRLFANSPVVKLRVKIGAKFISFEPLTSGIKSAVIPHDAEVLGSKFGFTGLQIAKLLQF